MKRLLASAGALATVAGTLAVGVSRGPVADVSLLVAVFLGVVALGLAVALVFESVVDRPVHSPYAPAVALAKAPSGRCRTCSTRLVAVGPLVVCRVCDAPPR